VIVLEEKAVLLYLQRNSTLVDDIYKCSSGVEMPSKVGLFIMVSNPIFTETEKRGNSEFFQKPKNQFLAACKPGFSVLNFDLQMSNYATMLMDTLCFLRSYYLQNKE